MSEKSDTTVGLTKTELLNMLAKMTAEAAAMHSKIDEVTDEANRNKESTQYWVGEYNKMTARLKKSEERVAELEAPLAALARSGGD